MDCATTDVGIQYLIDSLLTLDRIQALEHIADYGDKVLAITTFNFDATLREFSFQKLFDLIGLQIDSLNYCQLSSTASMSLLCSDIKAANWV